MISQISSQESRAAMPRMILIIATIVISFGFPCPGFVAAAEEAKVSSLRIDDDAELKSSVGMAAVVKGVVFAGTELTVRKVDPRESRVMLRIDGVYSHGDGFRYDLTWQAWEPGIHNLTEYLIRKDGSGMATLAALNVEATSVLPAGQVLPNEIQIQRNAVAGGYRTALLVGGLLWLIGLGFLISRSIKTRAAQKTVAEETPLTRLQQIELQLAAAASRPESLSPAAKAQLETLILAFWRDEKQLWQSSPAVALSKLRNDLDAGPLLAVLERWLYDRPERSQFDADALLKPFRRYAENQHKARADAIRVDSKAIATDNSFMTPGVDRDG
jgi:hypothetical protein